MLDDKEVYIPGRFNIYCMSCNRKYKSNEILKRWDGLLVCKDDWEPRHPQDFVRGIQEKSNILPYSFDVDGYQAPAVPGNLTNSTAISGQAYSGYAISGTATFWENGGSQTAGYMDGTAGVVTNVTIPGLMVAGGGISGTS